MDLFLVGLFLAMYCKTASKKIITKRNIKKLGFTLLGEVAIILELFLIFSDSIKKSAGADVLN